MLITLTSKKDAAQLINMLKAGISTDNITLNIDADQFLSSELCIRNYVEPISAPILEGVYLSKVGSPLKPYIFIDPNGVISDIEESKQFEFND